MTPKPRAPRVSPATDAQLAEARKLAGGRKLGAGEWLAILEKVRKRSSSPGPDARPAAGQGGQTSSSNPGAFRSARQRPTISAPPPKPAAAQAKLEGF